MKRLEREGRLDAGQDVELRRDCWALNEAAIETMRLCEQKPAPQIVRYLEGHPEGSATLNEIAAELQWEPSDVELS